LVREGADIESRDTWNRTPLHHASWFNAFEVAKVKTKLLSFVKELSNEIFV